MGTQGPARDRGEDRRRPPARRLTTSPGSKRNASLDSARFSLAPKGAFTQLSPTSHSSACRTRPACSSRRPATSASSVQRERIAGPAPADVHTTAGAPVCVSQPSPSPSRRGSSPRPNAPDRNPERARGSWRTRSRKLERAARAPATPTLPCRPREGCAAMAGSARSRRPGHRAPGPASSPRGRRHHSAGGRHRRGGFRKGPCVRSGQLRPRVISPRSRATKSVRAGSRSLRRTSRSTMTQMHAVSRRADSRKSHTATTHWQQAVGRTKSLSSRLVDAGRIASNERPWGVGVLCQSAKMCVVVRRCRALATGSRHAGPRFGERC